MITKAAAIRELVALLAPNDPAEQRRISRHHWERSVPEVRESLRRQRAIAGVTQAEIDRNCQLVGLPGM